MEEHRLFPALHDALETIEQGFGKHRATAGFEFTAKIGNDHIGQMGPTRTLAHLHARPLRAIERTEPAAKQRLGRRRGRAQDERAAMHLRHLRGDLASMIARARTLLITLLVLLIDNDDTEVMNGTE